LNHDIMSCLKYGGQLVSIKNLWIGLMSRLRGNGLKTCLMGWNMRFIG